MVPLYLALMIGHEKTAAMAVGPVARRLLRLVPGSGRIVFYGHAHYATDLALVCLIVLLYYGPGRTYLKGGVLTLFYICSGISSVLDIARVLELGAISSSTPSASSPMWVVAVHWSAARGAGCPDVPAVQACMAEFPAPPAGLHRRLCGRLSLWTS